MATYHREGAKRPDDTASSQAHKKHENHGKTVQHHPADKAASLPFQESTEPDDEEAERGESQADDGNCIMWMRQGSHKIFRNVN
jgi:hypothetical protein